MLKKTDFKGLEKDLISNIEGFITPIDWDEDDNIISISISTPEEEEYVVDDGPLKDELLRLVHKYITVTGQIAENEYGEKSILVKSYKLVDDR